ncbi:hypothetical protein DFJ74DRAFT_402875 [Hyaloraphidium curvatum]|nr:hypothetical protein DFJ74DRAFT_402875 [Hyaloraphidium curvatum]
MATLTATRPDELAYGQDKHDPARTVAALSLSRPKRAQALDPLLTYSEQPESEAPCSHPHPAPPVAAADPNTAWRARFANKSDLCNLRPKAHPHDARSDMGPFAFFDLPADLLPEVFRYLHDCELLKLSAASKQAYRACAPEFRYRVERIVKGQLKLDVDRPRKAVAEAHQHLEALHAAMGTSLAIGVKVDYQKGFPRTYLKACSIM